jgi:hypothetical protein
MSFSRVLSPLSNAAIFEQPLLRRNFSKGK